MYIGHTPGAHRLRPPEVAAARTWTEPRDAAGRRLTALACKAAPTRLEVKHVAMLADSGRQGKSDLKLEIAKLIPTRKEQDIILYSARFAQANSYFLWTFAGAQRQ